MIININNNRECCGAAVLQLENNLNITREARTKIVNCPLYIVNCSHKRREQPQYRPSEPAKRVYFKAVLICYLLAYFKSF